MGTVQIVILSRCSHEFLTLSADSVASPYFGLLASMTDRLGTASRNDAAGGFLTIAGKSVGTKQWYLIDFMLDPTILGTNSLTSLQKSPRYHLFSFKKLTLILRVSTTGITCLVGNES